MTDGKAAITEKHCGFEFRPKIYLGDEDPAAWDERTNAVCCWRPVWSERKDMGRCIWHADVAEKPIDALLAHRADGPERLDGAILRDIDAGDRRLSFSECGLRGAIFNGATIQNADFTAADLQHADFTDADLPAAEFPNADLFAADFTDTFLGSAGFTDVDLRAAEFTDADAFGTYFRHANCQNAVFTQTDCRRATFTSTLLYETVFADTRINSRTTFSDPETTFYESITSRPGCVYEENSHTADQLPDDVQPLEAARWVYRRLETLHEANALSEAARDFHISKEEAERALYWERGKRWGWGVKAFMWYLTKHGESVKHVLLWWGIIILVAGSLFPFVGGIKDSAGTVYAITSLAELGTRAGWHEMLLNMYFSVTTFSAIMDGDLAPAGWGSRVLVAGESIVGALLIALLIFVLGRRVTR